MSGGLLEEKTTKVVLTEERIEKVYRFPGTKDHTITYIEVHASKVEYGDGETPLNEPERQLQRRGIVVRLGFSPFSAWSDVVGGPDVRLDESLRQSYGKSISESDLPDEIKNFFR